MTFRVTPNTFVSQALSSLRQHNANLARLQAQISSGLRIQKPSDDPAATRSLLAERATDARLDSQLSTIATARSKLNLGVSQLLEANRLFIRAKEIALEANQPLEPGVAESFAEEVDQLLDQLLAVANTKDSSGYIFSGRASDTQAFADKGQGGATNIAYAGDAGSAQVAIGSFLSFETLLAGSEIFQPRDRQTTLVAGQTGAAAGSGTDSATGFGTLTVRHLTTTYAAGSGVAAGVSSASGDTVIGPAGSHVLTIDDTSGTGTLGTVSLNGGPTVAFTNADTDLKVTGPNGEVVFIDTTSITAGFSGDVDITATGSLSVDGGASETAIDFSTNQIVTHNGTGAVTNIDSSAIRRAGSDRLEYTGTADAFQALVQLRDDLRNTRELSSDEWHDSIGRRLEDIDRVRDHLLLVVGGQSVSLENLDALENRVSEMQLATRQIISELESTDISQAAIELQNEQNLLQFSMASTVAVMDISLLDFLR